MALFDLNRRRGVRREGGVPATAEPGAAEDRANGYAEALLGLALEGLSRGQEVLVLGLASWGTAWPERLLGRTRGVVVVDPDKKVLSAVRAYCQQTIEADPAGAEWVTRLGSQRFNVIILGDALTHQADPAACLRRLQPLLAPDGTVLAIVPNAAFGEQRLDLLQGEIARDFEPGGPLHRYTRGRLRELLAFTGFAVTDLVSYHQALFGPASAWVPELFPPAILDALDRGEDLATSHFIVQATPATSERLMRDLFDEQELWRKAVRNELARAAHGHDVLKAQLAVATVANEALAKELAESRRNAEALQDLTSRAELAVGRLAKEVDETVAELAVIKASFAYRLARWFIPVDEAISDPSRCRS